jgi:hypothetical protein
MAGIHRRRAIGHDLNSGDDLVDTRPDYLKHFPTADAILNDLSLGVLMGRQVCFEAGTV